ncbi:MAG: SURF1 family protein [Steroidobacteraceae bacterium]
MKLRVGSRVFAPSGFACLLTLAVMAGLVNLGLWQLRRADEKRELMVQAEQGRNTLLSLNAANAAGMNRYQRVAVAGSYDSAHQILLDNMPSSQGQPGYRVLTPLLLDDQSLVLVDRGWIAMNADRKPQQAIDVESLPHSLTGMLDELPRPGVRAGDAGIHADVWPQVLNYPTLQELQQLYGDKLQARIVLLDAAMPAGFERVWQVNLGFSPERHVGYAVQWFGMALTVLIIFVVVNLKRIEK